MQMILKEHEESGGKPSLLRVTTSKRNNIVIWDRDMCREVLVTKANAFHKPIELFYEPFNIFRKDASNILSAVDGPDWKRHHRYVSQCDGF